MTKTPKDALKATKDPESTGPDAATSAEPPPPSADLVVELEPGETMPQPAQEHQPDTLSAPHRVSQQTPKRPVCPACQSDAIGMAGGMRHCNQCGERF